MAFTGYITAAGRAFQAEVLAKGEQMAFTRAAGGSGTTADPANATAMANEQCDFLLKYSHNVDDRIEVFSTLDNGTVSAPFVWHEWGLFASDAEREVLYLISQDVQGQTISLSGDVVDYKHTIIINDDLTVTVEAAPFGPVTQGDIGRAFGVAPLDAEGKVPLMHLPPIDVGGVKTVNGVEPDDTGDVTLGAGDIGAAEAVHTHSAGDIDAGTIEVARLPRASSTGSGIVRLATDLEAELGTSTNVAVTPMHLQLFAKGDETAKYAWYQSLINEMVLWGADSVLGQNPEILWELLNSYPYADLNRLWNDIFDSPTIRDRLLPFMDSNPIMTSNTEPLGIATADSEYSTNTAFRAFDQSTSSVWRPVAATGIHWLMYEFAPSTAIIPYTLRINMIESNATVGASTFQASNNGSSWVNLATIPNSTSASFRAFNIRQTNEIGYSMYRLQRPSSTASYYPLVYELRIYGIRKEGG